MKVELEEKEKGHMQKDIADVRLTIKVKHFYGAVITVATITAVAVSGWLSLKADVANAKAEFKTEIQLARQESTGLGQRVAKIECLVEQQNRWHIFKEVPRYRC